MKKSLLLISVFQSVFAVGNNAAETEKPNIVFILADDMGYGDISFLKNDSSKIKTTHIDQLAQEGVVFLDAHSSSSVSTPTRYGVLTGRYNWRSTLKAGVLNGYSKALIPKERPTLGTMLKSNGYTTGTIGKWHLGWDWNNIDQGAKHVDFTKPIENGPTDRGFDYFYGISASLDMPPYVYVEYDMPTSVPDKETFSDGKYDWWRKGPTATDFVHSETLPNLVSRACEFIKKASRNDNPYFLYLPLPAPHTPILPTEAYRGKSGLGSYGDFVLMVDDMIGKVLQAIQESGEENNTIVVFTSDNGCSRAADIENLKGHGHSPNGIYRGSKSDLFDGGHRIPCILRWPQKAPHHIVEQAVCLTDFYATFADINHYRLKDSEGEDSYSLLPLIVNENYNQQVREALVHHSIEGKFSIRKGKWKLLLWPGSGGWSTPISKDVETLSKLPSMQLYDMISDPRETKNLVDEYPKVASELRDLLLSYIRNGRSTNGVPQKNEPDRKGEWKQLKEIESLKVQ